MHINTVFKNPTGRRQTSWLYTKRAKELNPRQLKTNPLNSRVEGLNLRPSDYKTDQRPNPSNTLPPSDRVS